MSNTLAIAAVTTTIRHVLHEALAGEPGPVGGADVTTLRPVQLSNADLVPVGSAGLNVYLYQVTPNHAGNLDDLPARGRDGALTRRPVAAVDLHYLISAYGDEAALAPQRLLARAALALTATPVFTRLVIEAAMDKYGAGATAFLADVDLADQAELVKVSPAPLSLEELSKLWGALGTPYLLSQAYTATVVLLEADLPARRALPVLRPDIAVRPFTRIALDSVGVVGDGAAVTGAELELLGGALLGTVTAVGVGPARLTPDPASTSTRIVVALDPAVPAGVHRVQVEHLQPADPVAGTPERVLGRSPGLPLLVRPTVGAIAATATEVTVPVEPPLQAGQRAVVTFARLSGGAPGDPGVVTATFAPVPPADAPLAELTVDRAALSDGTWLVRVSVDGAESLPGMSDDTYDRPVVTLP